MERIGVRALRAACAGSFVLLAGCWLPDHYSGRVISYNLQAEQAQEQQLLLNIIRASLRRPMQFTGLQSITGNAQASISPSLSIPFGDSANRPQKLLSPDVFGVGGSLSGGPQFTVPVLDTQEFYQGILKPIPLQILDYYLQQRYPREMLYDLFIQKIVITKEPGKEADNKSPVFENKSLVFENNALNDSQRQQFNLVLEYLLAAGLSTEHVDSSSPVGPAIASRQLQPKNADEAAKLIDSFAQAATANLSIKPAQVRGDQPPVGSAPLPGGSAGFALNKGQSAVRFCFAPHGEQLDTWLNKPPPQVYCGANHENAGISEEGIAQFPNFTLPNSIFGALDQLRRQQGSNAEPTDGFIRLEDFHNQPVSLKMYVRSTQGIMYYLGEVVRRALHTDLYMQTGAAPTPRTVQIRLILPVGAVAKSPCKEEGEFDKVPGDVTPLGPTANGATDAVQPNSFYTCENLFRVDKGYSASSFLSVEYDGDHYFIPSEPTKAGRTFEVIELVKQLFALNTSAKEFPSTSVFSIVAP